MKKRDADLEKFKRDLDGLTEKPQIVELAWRGFNAKQTCDLLNIPPKTYRRWFESDVEFRVRLYAAVCDR